MILPKEDIKVLEAIQEGMSDLKQAEIYTKIKKEKLKEIYNELEKLGLIKITKKFDEYYKEDFWDAELTQKGKRTIAE